MGAFAAVLDAVHFVSCCVPLLLCWNSKAERRQRMLRGRRRQHLLAVCVLMVVAGGFLKSRVTNLPADRPLIRRRLLHVTLQDNTEILGYILGLLSFVITCTSRFPAVCRAYKGQMFTWTSMFSGLLCSLASGLYAAAILLYDTQFGFLLRVMPWLLSAICCVTLDLLILVIHWCKRGTRQQFSSFSTDTQSLLGGTQTPAEDNAVMKRQRKQQVHLSAQTKTKDVQKMTEMGRYMDVSVQPPRKEVMTKDQLFDGKVRVIRVSSFCSSDTSYDSSVVSSDLEWDFEEANVQWREPTANKKHNAKQHFPPHGWPTNSKPCKICICAMSGLSQKTVPGTEECESVSSASLLK
ncbi:transmembrane protein 44 [Larimichthys crocea]|uniref:transmembrane protein 44 n=1 Tax=Larimichthys crocea TaxID=215358 RepID=UPI000F5E5427|nr:transmembrane protein 44 [Larimichthys crocea]